ncbi:MAG: glycosyltransferase family 2 protein [Candidatus Hydrogenedentota bacterium]|nr:MAG: glycosyltransferase family 2 protein [Candidatus Hydrogenedentota bacterium]
MKSPSISVIICNWNGKHFLEECLESLRKQSFRNFEVIVVDNGSTDGSVALLEERYSDFIRLVKLDKNCGFAGGNNRGIERSGGKYIALLNNDTSADERWLEELFNVMEYHPEVGMCASKLLIHDQRDRIDAVGHLIYPDGLNRGRGRFERDEGQYDELEEVFFAPGCGAVYSRRMLDEIGVFDEDFFSYGDDTDIGLRGRLAAWKCLYVPKAVVYHKISGSAGWYSQFKAFHVERNRVWIAVKYFPLLALTLSIYYTGVRFLLQAYGALAGKGASGKFADESSAWRLVLTLFRAYWSAFKGLPRMWKKRRQIQQLKRVSNKEFMNWLRKYGISAREIALKE